MIVPAAPDAATVSDAELVARTREGDARAFQALRVRHGLAMHRLARVLDPVGEHGDLVRPALQVAQASIIMDSGPLVALRPYLLSLVRRLHRSRASGAQSRPSNPLEHAFSGLPELSQASLWHRLVEHDRDEDLARLLGVNRRDVPLLVSQGMVELRAATLEGHLAVVEPTCYPLLSRALETPRPSALTQLWLHRHAAGCPDCALALRDDEELSQAPDRVLVERILGAAAMGYLRPSTGLVPDNGVGRQR
ncbi:MAG: hypothetical protein ACXVXC_15000 [Nocardioidaceae bacterium]